MKQIIGLQDSDRILTNASLSTEASGMQVLSQTFVTTTDGLQYFNPKVSDPHPDFPTMSIESVSKNFMPGSLISFNINSVGVLGENAQQYINLTGSAVPKQPTLSSVLPPNFLPKPTYSLFQNQGEYLYYPFIVQLSFVDILNQKQVEKILQIFNYKAQTKIPLQWRGLVLPRLTIDVSTIELKNIVYYGILCKSTTIEKRGFFCNVTVSFAETFARFADV